MGALRYYLVDAFTSRPFSGNPAAVVPLDRWPQDAWLQDFAMEMNLSETVYLVPSQTGFEIRWFTPQIEVDLCGHATLASAKVIALLNLNQTGREIEFSSRSGKLTARIYEDWIQLDFPKVPASPVAAPRGLLEALGVAAQYVGRNAFDYLVEVASEAELRGLNPDFTKLASVAARGIMVTAISADPAYDFVSRFFAPAAGVNEDPVTGSAHCCLADYWQHRLGKSKFTAYQASARGGVLQVEVVGERVLLGGQAVVVAAGELLIEIE